MDPKTVIMNVSRLLEHDAEKCERFSDDIMLLLFHAGETLPEAVTPRQPPAASEDRCGFPPFWPRLRRRGRA
ncbi:hypothetical protein E0J21_05490 [Rhizobium laguerreae]|nr:hypothetical protein E0J21_05490 [Rhizobium laguerreae]